MVESMLDIEKTKQLLKRHDLRSSKPRLAILGVFHERPRHITAENLFYELKHRGENLSLSTVYLNLGVLKEAGLVRQLQGANGFWQLLLYPTDVPANVAPALVP